MPLTEDDLEEFYGKQDAAQLLHVSLRTVDRMIAQQEIETVRVGSGRGRVFITKRAILDHLNRGLVKAKPGKTRS